MTYTRQPIFPSYEYHPMGRLFLCALAGILAAEPALGQAPAPASEAVSAEPVRPDEIRELKTAVARLQDQINRLTLRTDVRPTETHPEEAPSQAPGETPMPVAAYFTGPAPSRAGAIEADQRNKLNAVWKNGLQLESEDEAFRVHVGGRLQFDAGGNIASQTVQFGPGGIGELQDGAVFRRARLRIDGSMYRHLEWVAEFDFANDVENDTGSSSQPIGSPSFTNVWVGITDLPALGTVRVGWMKEPIGFEHLTSSRWLSFMEPAPGIGSLGLRSPGVLLRNTDPDERVTWAFGFFHAQNTNFGFGSGDGEYAETGRLTWLPWYEEDGCQLLHLGVGATHRHLSGDQINIRGRPAIRTMPGSLEPSLAETGTIGGSTEEVAGVELAGVFGPWTLQSEYYCTWIHDAVFPNDPPPIGISKGTLFYQGVYVEVLYFLSGEHRAYNRKDAVFDRVAPLRNFNVWDGPWGCGAWQVGVRYSYLDLQDKGVNGATLHDIVLGLNWFLNPSTKVQWNFAVDHRSSTPEGSSGWTYIGGARLALDF